MPRARPNKELNREENFKQLPMAARQDIAQARNMRARMLEKREEYLAESKRFKAMVWRLHKVHKMAKHAIAVQLGLTWDRVNGIIADHKRGDRP